MLLDENVKYKILRHSIICFFAREDRISSYGLDVSDFPKIMNFCKDLYYEHCKNREDVQNAFSNDPPI